MDPIAAPLRESLRLDVGSSCSALDAAGAIAGCRCSAASANSAVDRSLAAVVDEDGERIMAAGFSKVDRCTSSHRRTNPLARAAYNGVLSSGEPMTLHDLQGTVCVAALLVCGCHGLWDPFLATRSRDPADLVDGGTPKTQGVCPTANVCWQNPLPQGHRLNGVVAVSADDVWAVGAAGTVLHYSAGGFSQIPSQTTAELAAVAASSAQDVWCVGALGTTIHITGQDPVLRKLAGIGNLYAVASLGPQQAFAAGYNNASLKWNGSDWMQTGPGISNTYRGIVALDADNIWLASQVGGIWQWHNQPDISEARASGGELYAMWGSSIEDMWAVGDKGQILKRYPYQATPWQLLTAPTTASLYGIWGTGSQDLWAVGDAGTILRIDGINKQLTSETSGTQSSLFAVSGRSSADVWAVGDSGIILHRNSKDWTVLSQGPTRTLRSIWASSSSDAWAVGDGGLMMHWDGTRWDERGGLTGAALKSVSGSAANDVWAVGENGTVLHWDGTSWSQRAIAGTASLNALYTPTSSVTWIAASGGVLYLYQPETSSWKVHNTSITRSLLAIAGVSVDDIWAVGQAGALLHYNNTLWNVLPSPTGQDLTAIWAGAANSAWFVGTSGAAIYWDGAMFRMSNGAGTIPLRAIWGPVGGPQYAAGDSGQLFQINGMTWTPLSTGTLYSLYGLAGPAPSSATTPFWMVGEQGTILQFKP